MKKYRTGFGFDLHRLTKRKKGLILGGYKINSDFGLEAVSDGDLVLHAAADAVCGAACLGDIGDYYQPRDKKNKNISSKKIVEFILNKIKGKYELVNIDITIVAERPRLFPHKKGIVESLKTIFKIEDINVKIKSKEKTQALGGPEAVCCFAAVLLSGGAK